MEINMQYNNALEVVPNWSLEPNQVTESEVVTEPVIKNWGGDKDPFMSIEKVENRWPDGTINPMTYSILGEDGTQFKDTTSKYLLVSNKDLVDVVSEVMVNSMIDWKHEKRFFSNKGDFRDIYYANDTGLEKSVSEVGDLIGMVLEITNSYNGNSSAGIQVYFQRLACLNGMTSKVYGFGHTFKHTAQNVNWEEQIIQATSLLRNQSEHRLGRFVEACGKLQKPIDNTEIKLIREKYIPKGTGSNQLPGTQFGQLMDKYYEDGDFTAWGLLNAGTNVLWHADKLTNANFSNNTIVVDGLLQYGKDTYDEPFVDPNQTEMFQS